MTTMIEPVRTTAATMAALPRSAYGGFWIRFVAHLIDLIVLMILLGVVFSTTGASISINVAKEDGAYSLQSDWWWLLLTQVYHAGFVASGMQATLGKAAMGLVVTDLEGRRLGFARALGRNLMAFLSYITWFFGFFMIAWTQRRQSLHDKIIGSLVVHKSTLALAAAGQESPTAPQSGAHFAGIAMAVVLGVPGCGILAAIAIPAYQDYGERQQIAQLADPVHPSLQAMTAFHQQHHRWPATLDELEQASGIRVLESLAPPARERVQDVRAGGDGSFTYHLVIRNKEGELRLQASATGGQVSWACSYNGAIRQFVPQRCRDEPQSAQAAGTRNKA